VFGFVVLVCVVIAFWLLFREAPTKAVEDNSSQNDRLDSDENLDGFAQNDRAKVRTRACADHINLINEAIALGKDVHFRYEKKDGTVTRRTVTPREMRRLSIRELQALIGNDVMITREGRLCMFGHCHLRDADRVFAVDRMQSLSLQ